MARPKRSLGQNFLVDPNLQRKIVAALGAGAGDAVLEVGPGRGALTRHLAGSVGRLVAVELDDALAAALEAELGGVPGVEVVHADILRFRPESAFEDVAGLRVIGNVPYNITTPLLFHLLERPRPAVLVLMVQKEVAERIAAPPGGRTYGALSVGVRSVADVELLFTIGRAAFRPVPDVDSTVLRIVPHAPPRTSPAEERDLRTLARVAFGWRRKQLQKTLRSSPEYGLDAAALGRVQAATGLELEARPETLAPERLAALAGALRAEGLPRRDTEEIPGHGAA